jgi:hypothetical protein
VAGIPDVIPALSSIVGTKEAAGTLSACENGIWLRRVRGEVGHVGVHKTLAGALEVFAAVNGPCDGLMEADHNVQRI